MTDYKQLCAELIRTYPMAWGPSGKWRNPEQNLALERARAALAESEPEGPTDEELELVASQFCDFYHAHLSSPDGWRSSRSGLTDFARAVLARWGNHPGSPDSSLQPVPVSERLPEPGDCDTEGRCWTWAIGTWRLSRINRSFHTHWLPAHALPLPS